MTNSWKKHGLIFKPDTSKYWMKSHAQLPVVDHIKDTRYRIYFASRTQEQRSHIGYFEIDITEPTTILYTTQDPLLKPGPIGHFDEHGIYPSSILTIGKEKWMYYIGWNQGVKAPLFYASIGLAISKDNGETFTKYSPAPIMARSATEPCLVTSPTVFRKRETEFIMLYVSGIKWEEVNTRLQSYYNIKIASSQDGIHWNPTNKTAIDFQSPLETNIARIWVLPIHQNNYLGFFCSNVSGKKYCIQTATSTDGLTWHRESEVNFPKNDYDMEMQAYPSTILYKNTLYMFYNGNQFGRDGICLATQEIN